MAPPFGGAERGPTALAIARYREAVTGRLNDTPAKYHQTLLISMDKRLLAEPKPYAEFMQLVVAQLALGCNRLRDLAR